MTAGGGGRWGSIDAEVRAAAVAAVTRLVAGGHTEIAALGAVAEQIGVSRSAVREWVRASGAPPRQTIAQLRRTLALRDKQLAAAAQLNRDLVEVLQRRRTEDRTRS